MQRVQDKRVPRLTEGCAYRVTYTTQLGNGQWWEKQYVAVFVGQNKQHGRLQLIWSGRPQYGTMEQLAMQITRIEPASRSEVCVPFNLKRATKPSWAS